MIRTSRKCRPSCVTKRIRERVGKHRDTRYAIRDTRSRSGRVKLDGPPAEKSASQYASLGYKRVPIGNGRGGPTRVPSDFARLRFDEPDPIAKRTAAELHRCDSEPLRECNV